MINFTVVTVAEKDDRISFLEDKCEELEQLEDIERKLEKAEEEVNK